MIFGLPPFGTVGVKTEQERDRPKPPHGKKDHPPKGTGPAGNDKGNGK